MLQREDIAFSDYMALIVKKFKLFQLSSPFLSSRRLLKHHWIVKSISPKYSKFLIWGWQNIRKYIVRKYIFFFWDQSVLLSCLDSPEPQLTKPYRTWMEQQTPNVLMLFGPKCYLWRHSSHKYFIFLSVHAAFSMLIVLMSVQASRCFCNVSHRCSESWKNIYYE